MAIFIHGGTTQRITSDVLLSPWIQKEEWGAKQRQSGRIHALSVWEDSSRANAFLAKLVEAYIIVFPLLMSGSHWKVLETVKGWMFVEGNHPEAVRLWLCVTSFSPHNDTKAIFIFLSIHKGPELQGRNHAARKKIPDENYQPPYVPLTQMPAAFSASQGCAESSLL